jgi:hypothetical protein
MGKKVLVSPDRMSPVIDRFVYIDIPIPDFQVESAIRVGTNPGFILNGGSLTAKVRQRDQVSGLTFLTFGKIVVKFQKIHLPSSLINAVYNNKVLTGKRTIEQSQTTECKLRRRVSTGFSSD